MRIDIFCESGEGYGLGHFYRALKLAMLCAQSPLVRAITLHNRGDFVPPDSLPGIECKNYEWLSTQPELLELAIVDSYEAEAWFYHRLSKHCRVLVCLDDYCRDVYPQGSVILNPTARALEHFSPSAYTLWCGGGYAILPPPALIAQAQDTKTRYNTHKRHIFVSFGGVDEANLAQLFLDELARLGGLEESVFHLVLGRDSSHRQTSLHRVELYSKLTPLEFLSLAARCDYALCAGGGSMLELLALKIPSVVVESASNQRPQIAQFSELGAIAWAEGVASALQILSRWLKDSDEPRTLRCAIKSLQLGEQLAPALGRLIERVEADSSPAPKPASASKPTFQSALAREGELGGALRALEFSTLSEEQIALVRTMRNHPQVARWMYAGEVSQRAHSEFVSQLKQEATKRYWLYMRADSDDLESSLESYLGVGSLTRINLLHKQAFLGIYANPLSSQHSKGAQILRHLEAQAFEVLGLHALHLEVLASNARAIAFYERAGYEREGILKDFVRVDSQKFAHNFVDVILMYKRRPDE